MTNINKDQMEGLFIANYRISDRRDGGYTLFLSLVVDTFYRNVSGYGYISQATHPPKRIPTIVKGDCSYMCTMDNSHIMITLRGHDPQYPEQMNLRLRMSLEEDWKSGVAVYQFFDGHRWVGIDRAKVEIEENQEINNIQKLAEQVKNSIKEPVE